MNAAAARGIKMCDKEELKKIEELAKHTDNAIEDVKKNMATKSEVQESQNVLLRTFIPAFIGAVIGFCGLVYMLSNGIAANVSERVAGEVKKELVIYIGDTDKRLDRIEARLDKLDSSMVDINGKLDKLIQASQK